MQNSSIVVVGSLNMDHVINCERLPRPGETIAGSDFNRYPGGKGANQAVAAGQLQASPLFIGARGQDESGKTLENDLQSRGVKTDLKHCQIRTGTAHIFVTADGENHIVIIPGANDELYPEDIEQRSEIFRTSDILLMQLEIPLKTVIKTAELAADAGVTVLLDPAPAKTLSSELLQKVDYLLPNKEELGQLTPEIAGESEKKEIKRAELLLDKGVNNIILTRGNKGAKLINRNRTFSAVARDVEAIDTTAAGDAFAGAFAVGLARGVSVEKSVRLGVAYGSAAVTAAGAQSSLKSLAEFSKFAPEIVELLPRGKYS